MSETAFIQQKILVQKESQSLAILSPVSPETWELAQSIWIEESNGNTFAPGVCHVYLDQLYLVQH